MRHATRDDTENAVARIAPVVLDEVRRRHAEPHRAYHDWSHVQALLALHDEVRDRLDDARAVAWAILFHDAVYDPRAADNEERSARLLETLLADAADAETLARAAVLVRATARHVVPAAPAGQRADAAIFLDMDLSILAAPAAAFDRYDRAIRAEYAHVAEADYRAGRAAILAAFLDRPRLFLSDWGFARFERAARRNLARALARLAAD